MRDYDLLIGILASQLRLVSRGTLVYFSRRAGEHPDGTLLDFLSETRALNERDQQLLCRIVDTLIHAHHGDEKAALKTFGGDEAVAEAFAGTMVQSETGWVPSEDQTVLAERLPHGLPVQIAPEAIGRYTRGSEYARGGIGRILLVHDEQIGRDVILKELLPEHLVSPTDSTLSRMPKGESPRSPMRQSAAMVARFLQEAKITGQLEHPSIVPVYELGTRMDGQLYYTMKLVRGETLAESIKSRKRPEERLGLLRSFLDVCQAMAYAHSKGVIHRDLKPSNIMVGEFGECVVLDWGLAKMQKDVDAHREALGKTLSQLKLGEETQTAFKTRSKDVLGTPLYMAPEQARGEIDVVGVQSDVYSLGVILYEILSGDLPHPWTNSIDTIRRVGSIPAPPVKEAAPQTPPELAAICDKALAFRAGNRYSTAQELASDVQRFLEGAVVDAYAYKVTDILGRLYRRHRALILTTSIATAAILTTGVISYIKVLRANEFALAAQKRAEDNAQEAQAQKTVAVGQQNRAEEAEEKTAKEKYISDIRLADAYIRDLKFQAADDILRQTSSKYRDFEWGYLAAQLHQESATLTGHTSNVFDLVLSPDGTLLLSLSGDSSARLWELKSHQSVQSWKFPSARVLHGAFDPTGGRVALCLDDGLVVLVDPANGQELRRLAGHTAPVNDCVFSVDGRELLTGGNDRKVLRWNLDDGSFVQPLPDHDSPVKRVTLTEDGHNLLTETSDDTLRLFDAASGAPLGKAPGHYHEYAADGDLISAVSGNGAVLYRGSDLKLVLQLPHEDTVNRARVYPGASLVLTTCNDGSARVFNFPDGKLLAARNMGAPVRDFQLTPTGDRLVAVTYGGAGKVWSYPEGSEINSFAGHRGAVQRMVLARDGQSIFTSSIDLSIREWSMNHSPIVIRQRAALGPANSAAVSVQAGLAAFVTDDGTVSVRAANGAVLYESLIQSISGRYVCALSPDGKLLGLVVDDFLPLIISLPDGQVVARLDGHRGTINSLEFNSDGSRVVTTSWDATVRLWDTRSGVLLSTLEGHGDSTVFAAFSDDGSWVASIGRDKSARIWNSATGAEQLQIDCGARTGHGAFSPDSRYFAVPSGVGSVEIWDVTLKSKSCTIAGYGIPASRVCFSPAGTRLAILTEDGGIHIADARTGANLVDLAGVPGDSTGLQFSANGDSLLLSTRASGLLRILSLSPEKTADADAIAYRDNWNGQNPSHETAPMSINTVHRFIPAPLLTEFAGALSENKDTGAHGLRLSDAFLGQSEFWRFGLAPEDELLNLNGIPTQDVASQVGGLLPDPLSPTGVMLYFDILRNAQPIRVQCHVLPVATRSETVTLPPAQASALLKEAIDLLTRGEGDLLLLNRKAAARLHRTIEPPDDLAGYWVNYFPDSVGTAMVKAAGLRSGSVISRIGESPVRSLSALREWLNTAKATLDTGGVKSTTTIDMDEGAFARSELSIEIGVQANMEGQGGPK